MAGQAKLAQETLIGYFSVLCNSVLIFKRAWGIAVHDGIDYMSAAF